MSFGRSTLVLSLCGLTAMLMLLTHLYSIPNSLIFTKTPPSSLSLGIASQIYVISLPRRTDRSVDIAYLMERLGLRWKYVDAIDAQSRRVRQIHSSVERYRGEHPDMFFLENSTSKWTQPDSSEALVVEVSEANEAAANMACATEDNRIAAYTPDLPDYRVLTLAKIACWESHLSVIRRVAEREQTAIVLEDDVDMEKDIEQRLSNLWGMLPDDWDMVFLGHCWSTETQNSELAVGSSERLHPNTTHIHPSHQPKCTHAYVLSPAGARLLLDHLSYPPFAYSRAIDQAYGWLILSGRIKSFSVVPSVVVQRKTTKSDIGESRWKDTLEDGVLEERDSNAKIV